MESSQSLPSDQRIEQSPSEEQGELCHQKDFKDKREVSKKSQQKRTRQTRKGPEKLSCETCHKEFKSKTILSRHIRFVHNKIKPFKCDLCSRTFTYESVLIAHKKGFHEKIRDHACDLCGRAFAQKQHLSQHKKIVHDKIKEHQCASCGKDFGTNADLVKHMRAAHRHQQAPDVTAEDALDVGEVAIPDVNAPLEQEALDEASEEDDDEISIASGPDLSPEESEDAEFDQLFLEKSEENTESPDQEAESLQMEQDLDYKELKDPEGGHNSDSDKIGQDMSLDIPYNLEQKCRCPICNKKLSSKGSIKTHINSVHRRLRRFKCEICAKALGSKSILLSHIKTVHEKIKSFMCEVCSNTFTQNRHLRDHRKVVHDKIKEHICDRCGRSFSQKTHLKQHNKIVHDKLKEFRCSFCGKEFGLKKDMLKHSTRAHSQVEEPIPEAIEAPGAPSLDQHRDINNNLIRDAEESIEVAFKCGICEAGFGLKKDLLMHTRVVHMEAVENQCDVCFEEFQRKTDLSEHIKAVHQI